MPKKYKAIKAQQEAAGKSPKEAATIAAKTYNAQRKPGQAPVTRNYEKTKRKQAAKKTAAKRRPRRVKKTGRKK